MILNFAQECITNVVCPDFFETDVTVASWIFFSEAKSNFDKSTTPEGTNILETDLLTLITI